MAKYLGGVYITRNPREEKKVGETSLERKPVRVRVGVRGRVEVKVTLTLPRSTAARGPPPWESAPVTTDRGSDRLIEIDTWLSNGIKVRVCFAYRKASEAPQHPTQTQGGPGLGSLGEVREDVKGPRVLHLGGRERGDRRGLIVHGRSGNCGCVVGVVLFWGEGDFDDQSKRNHRKILSLVKFTCQTPVCTFYSLLGIVKKATKPNRTTPEEGDHTCGWCPRQVQGKATRRGGGRAG